MDIKSDGGDGNGGKDKLVALSTHARAFSHRALAPTGVPPVARLYGDGLGVDSGSVRMQRSPKRWRTVRQRRR